MPFSFGIWVWHHYVEKHPYLGIPTLRELPFLNFAPICFVAHFPEVIVIANPCVMVRICLRVHEGIICSIEGPWSAWNLGEFNETPMDREEITDPEVISHSR